MTVLADRPAEHGQGDRLGVVVTARPGVVPARVSPPIPQGRSTVRREPRRRVVGGDLGPGRLVIADAPQMAVVACRRVHVRRRVVALVAAAVLAAGVVVGLFALPAPADGTATVPAGTTVVQVVPGESLWELAQRVAPDSSTSQVVERIRQLNGLRGSAIHPGEPLIVPDGGARS